MLYENYQSPWLNEELKILQDAAGKFFAQEFLPHTEKWTAQGKIDRDAWRAPRWTCSTKSLCRRTARCGTHRI